MKARALLILGAYFAAQPVGAQTFEALSPTETHVNPCNYDDNDARRIDFMAAYQAAHKAELGASCVIDSVVVDRLKLELEAISVRAQARNPDVNLSTMEAQTGFEACRIPPGDIGSFCEKSSAVAIANFTMAMNQLRSFTNSWQ
jgi:hypothetical protein